MLRLMTLLLCTLTTLAIAKGPEGWNHPPAKLPEGSIHKTFHSASMNTDVGYVIYLPPDYAAKSDQRYPVIYSLHGRGGTEGSFLFAIEQFDKAIRDKQIPAAIYVLPCGEANAGYVDSVDGKIRSDTAIVKELIPHIDSTYRTLPDRNHRAIEGFSMGGQGALLFAFKYPELFCSVAGYGAGLANGVELQKELPEVFKKMHNDSIEQFDSTSAWAYVKINADKIRGQVSIRLGLGDKDQHLSRNHHMNAVLEELKIPFEYTELPGVGHNAKMVYQMIGVAGWQAHFKQFK